MVLMVPYLKFNGGFDKPLAKRMLIYSYPILILGVAGILNQVADKIIFRHIYPDKVEAKTQLANLWRLQQDCHDYGNAHSGIPLCL